MLHIHVCDKTDFFIKTVRIYKTVQRLNSLHIGDFNFQYESENR